MRRFQFLWVITFFFISCDDPSLNQQDIDGDGFVEPILELKQLSTIDIAQNVMTNITEDINIQYNQQELVRQISFNGVSNTVYTFQYAENNRLEAAVKTDDSIITTYNFTYINDTVFIEYVDTNGDVVEKQLFTDNQNRINRVVTTITGSTGNTVQTEDLRYRYTANFNVDRIDSIDSNGFSIISYSEFTYEFNNNPFRDMNDVLRLLVFPEFVPYTRYLPKSRNDFAATASGFDLERSFNYTYTLRDDEFPSLRDVTKTEGGTTTTSFEFFNYL
ncbi:MAG: hypothetical protein ABF274_10935 [Nonlabens sp.]|uniref:hypothetical protein n=1 Tax=Nonlabens sp. TaxID=1888209 RepID=UPI003219C1C2